MVDIPLRETHSELPKTSNQLNQTLIRSSYERFLHLSSQDQQTIMQIIHPKPVPVVNESEKIRGLIIQLMESTSFDERVDYLRTQEKESKVTDQYEVIERVFKDKFKGSIKSKEETIKFCMRKAFKFVYERIYSNKKQRLTKKQQKVLKNKYFGISNDSEYALPFRSLFFSSLILLKTNGDIK